MSETEKGERFVLEARGTINPEDRALATAFLGKLGLDVKFTAEEEYSRFNTVLRIVDNNPETEKPYKLADITSPDDYLVLEHFEDFAELRPDVKRGLVTRAFTNLLDVPVYGGHDPGTSAWINRIAERDIRPRQGLQYTTREKLDLPDYSDKSFSASTSGPWARKYHLRNYAIQAGSIIEVAKRLESGKERATKHDEGIIILGYQLASQFTESKK